MTKKKTTRGSRSKPDLAPTLGPLVCQWIEAYLVHAEGDYLGQPVRLRDWERAFFYRAYELNPDGTRRYNRVLLGMPKGNAKTEIAAMTACCELAGPVQFDGWNGKKPKGKMRTAPDIPVGAASYDQANLAFGAARKMIEEGPLKPYFTSFEKEIQPKGKTGKLYRVAAEAGTNDGLRPTFFVADELHEWLGRKERVHLVISNGRAKRRDSWELNISTAGFDRTSLLYRLYEHGLKGKDEKFLFIWYQAGDGYDLTDPKQLETAILEANPAANDFLSLQGITDRYYEIPEYEWRRYHLNQWTSAPVMFIPHEQWQAAATERAIAPKTPIVLAFDGSYNRDSTALIGATLEEKPHLFVVGCWERPENAPDEWSVDKDDVERTIDEALGQYEVANFAYDETFGRTWSFFIDGLQAKGVNTVAWNTRSLPRMAPACGQFAGALRAGDFTHDGDVRLAEHIGNAITKETRYGVVLTKDYKGSERHIDLAVAAVIGYDMAVRGEAKVEWALV